ncbi:MAG: MFS transporter, partial [Gammaproteobacteria bacterium]|nr:MFS transporter [Gammaproteobacteria bacterium]
MTRTQLLVLRGPAWLASRLGVSLAVLTLAGLGAATVLTGGQIMVGDLATAENRGRMMSTYQGFFMIGVGLGPTPGGVLAVHITNRFLDLLPVVQTAATHFGKQARLVAHEGDRSELSFYSNWVLVTADGAFFEQPALQAAQAIEARPGF